MFWKKKNKIEKTMRLMNELLKKSFSNVKRDTSNIFQWLNYFYRKNMEQEQNIKSLQLELTHIPKTREEIHRIIDEHYSVERLLTRIRELSDKVDDLARIQAKIQYPQQALPLEKEENHGILRLERRLERLEQKKLSMKERIIKRLTRNSKEYVKSVMLSYIRKYERISALQLKELIVDEQQLCSKSSFYRILEEIEELDDIGIIRQGKEKHYLAKVSKHNTQ